MIRIVILAAGMLVIGVTAATAQEKDCFSVTSPAQATLGSILINRCTGATWVQPTAARCLDGSQSRRSGSKPSSSLWGPVFSPALRRDRLHLRGPTIDSHGIRALGRRLRPHARKLDQGVFLGLGFGFGSPTHGLFGVLPELIGL